MAELSLDDNFLTVKPHQKEVELDWKPRQMTAESQQNPIDPVVQLSAVTVKRNRNHMKLSFDHNVTTMKPHQNQLELG